MVGKQNLSAGKDFSIYKITNVYNSEIYVGLTQEPLEKRLRFHYNVARKENGNGMYRMMHELIANYGRVPEGVFKIILLETGTSKTRADKLARKQYWMDKLHPTLNTYAAIGTVCVHDKLRWFCIDCGGSQLCHHGCKKHICRDCGGSQICPHLKQKSHCRDCGGKSYCQHGKKRSYCKECGGSQICTHNRIRSYCKDCGGGSICEHNRVRAQCKECGGSRICEHQRQKSNCKDCGGSQICGHNRIRAQCKECGGSQICKHQRYKSDCKDCSPTQCEFCGKIYSKAYLPRHLRAVHHVKILKGFEGEDWQFDVSKLRVF